MGESMSSEPKVITSFEEAPQSLRDKCDKEVLRAFFNAHFSITEKSVNDDKRFYLDDGRRIKDDDILVAYMKDRKVWTEPGVEIRTITGELTNKFGEKKLKDFFAAGFFLTKKRIKKNKWRYYLPDGRCLDSEKKLDDFLLEKLRPAFDKELCDRVIDTAATAIPGVDKSELFISDTENEKAACLNVKLDGKVYKEAILPYVSYEGIISSSLYNNLYSRCTVLHKRNIERFEKSHDLKALKQIAESILLSLQVDEKHKNKGKEYKTFFKKANATNDLIFKTYIDYKLQTRIQNESTIIVWSKEDTWKIEITSQYGNVILWHNNYYIAKDGKRKTLPEFHNQFPNEPGLKFSKAINCIAKYSPSYHIEQKELEKIEPSILIVIHHLKQEEKQRSTIIGAFLYRIKLTLYTNGYHSHSKLKQTIQEFHIVRTPNETPNENGRYCIVYKSNTVYAYNIGVFDTQKQSFTKSYSKDLITNIANVVAWKKL